MNDHTPPNETTGDLVDRWQALGADIDALPCVQKARKGDWVAIPYPDTGYQIYIATSDWRALFDNANFRILRRAPHDWQIGCDDHTPLELFAEPHIIWLPPTDTKGATS